MKDRLKVSGLDGRRRAADPDQLQPLLRDLGIHTAYKLHLYVTDRFGREKLTPPTAYKMWRGEVCNGDKWATLLEATDIDIRDVESDESRQKSGYDALGSALGEKLALDLKCRVGLGARKPKSAVGYVRTLLAKHPAVGSLSFLDSYKQFVSAFKPDPVPLPSTRRRLTVRALSIDTAMVVAVGNMAKEYPDQIELDCSLHHGAVQVKALGDERLSGDMIIAGMSAFALGASPKLKRAYQFVAPLFGLPQNMYRRRGANAEPDEVKVYHPPSGFGEVHYFDLKSTSELSVEQQPMKFDEIMCLAGKTDDDVWLPVHQPVASSLERKGLIEEVEGSGCIIYTGLFRHRSVPTDVTLWFASLLLRTLRNLTENPQATKTSLKSDEGYRKLFREAVQL